MKKESSKSSFNTFQVATIAILTSAFSLIMGLLIANTTNVDTKYSKELNNFISDYLKLKDEYYEEIDDEEVLDKGLQAIINSLDPYTTVIDDSLSNTLETKLEGKYKGIGVEVYNDIYGNIIVDNVIDNTVAQKVGINSGDILIKFNELSLSGVSTTDFVNMVKEAGDSNFTLKVLRNGEEKDFILKREEVELTSVYTNVYEDNNKKIGYIYVELFALNTYDQFLSAINELEQEGINSLIVDLRDNTGGHLNTVENMLNIFLDKTHVIYQIESKVSKEKHYSESKKGKDYPVIVLVNEISASASEIFASAMQEEYKAIIVGKTTFGKGTVQEVLPYDQNINYKITTKKWLTPNGKWINGVGVVPDVEVENNVDSDIDNQLQEAIDILKK